MNAMQVDAITEIAEILGLTDEQVLAHMDIIRDLAGTSVCVDEASDLVRDHMEAVAADECGVTIVADEPTVEHTDEPKAASVTTGKVKCKCCGFQKKARRVNAEGICKVCYVTLATATPGEPVVVVGRQGLKGRNVVSVMIGGERVKVQRKVRIDA